MGGFRARHEDVWETRREWDILGSLPGGINADYGAAVERAFSHRYALWRLKPVEKSR
jgi:hypothetical protein